MRVLLSGSNHYDDTDDVPTGIDEFREALARRIEAFMESRADEEGFDEAVDAGADPLR